MLVNLNTKSVIVSSVAVYFFSKETYKYFKLPSSNTVTAQCSSKIKTLRK